MMFRHVAVACATTIASVAPALPQDGGPLLELIEAARYATEICPGLRIDEERVVEIVRSLNLPQSSIAKALDENEMAILQPAPPPSEPAEEPPATGAPPSSAVNPACGIALAEFGPNGTRLPGLLQRVSIVRQD